MNEQHMDMATCRLIVRHLAREGGAALEAEPLAAAFNRLPPAYRAALRALRRQLLDGDGDATVLVPTPNDDTEWCSPAVWTPTSRA